MVPLKSCRNCLIYFIWFENTQSLSFETIKIFCDIKNIHSIFSTTFVKSSTYFLQVILFCPVYSVGFLMDTVLAWYTEHWETWWWDVVLKNGNLLTHAKYIPGKSFYSYRKEIPDEWFCPWNADRYHTSLYSADYPLVDVYWYP